MEESAEMPFAIMNISKCRLNIDTTSHRKGANFYEV